MKRFFKVLGVAVLLFVLTVAGWAAAVFWGWTPVPPFVTDTLAQVAGLTPEQGRTLNRAVNVYSVIKNSPEAPILDKAFELARTKTASSKAWLDFARENYPKVSPATLEKIRQQLAVKPEDFADVKTIVEKHLASGTPDLSAAETQRLERFARDYGLADLLNKLN